MVKDLGGLEAEARALLGGSRRSVEHLLQRIEAHLDAHEGYVAFSGGKDSLVVLDLVRRVDPEVPVVFFDSGLEFPETLQFIAKLQEAWDLNLVVIPADPPVLEILSQDGGWDHSAPDGVVPSLRRVLITGPSKKAHEDFGPGELWGVRAQESRGRAIGYAKPLRGASPEQKLQQGGVIARNDGTVAYSPIWDWTTAEVFNHIAHSQLPLNPLYQRLAALGVKPENQRTSILLDGEFLSEGRAMWLARGWPSIYSQLAMILPRLREY